MNSVSFMERSCFEYLLQYIRGVALFSCCMPSYLARGAHPKKPMTCVCGTQASPRSATSADLSINAKRRGANVAYNSRLIVRHGHVWRLGVSDITNYRINSIPPSRSNFLCEHRDFTGW